MPAVPCVLVLTSRHSRTLDLVRPVCTAQNRLVSEKKWGKVLRSRTFLREPLLGFKLLMLLAHLAAPAHAGEAGRSARPNHPSELELEAIGARTGSLHGRTDTRSRVVDRTSACMVAAVL